MQVILYVWLGMVVTLVSLALVALARCILNRSKVERVREQVENIIHSQLQHENHCQLIQPMLGEEYSLLQLQRDFAKHYSAWSWRGPVLGAFSGQCEIVKSR